MKYILIEEINGDMFTEEFEAKGEAIKRGDNEWDSTCENDKKRTGSFYLLESENPDEDADNHFDGNIIKSWK